MSTRVHSISHLCVPVHLLERGQLFRALSDGQPVGQVVIRQQLSQGSQHEGPLLHPRVGHGQDIGAQVQVVVHKDIQVD